MSEKKRILILTADAGFGHRSAANAILAALEKKYGTESECTILNPLDDKRAPFFLRDQATDYDRLVNSAPELYRLGYEASDNNFPTQVMESALTLGLYEIMQDMVKQYNPDAIVTTYPLYQAPLISYFKLNKYYVPLLTVVTDLVSVHRLWFAPGVEQCLVPTTEVEALAIKHKVAQNKIHITGIPVSPDFKLKKRNKKEMRKDLGWDPNLPTFLAVGSRRVDQLVEMLNVINHFGSQLQVVAVAGKDEELYDELKKIEWHIPAHVYDFVENMPELMMAADAIICKAGGLIVTESLACGLPILLIDFIPGQEEGNRDYVVKHGAGAMINSPIKMLETLSHWVAGGGKELRQVACNSRRVGKPNSAFEVADFVWRAALHGPVNKRGRSGLDLPGLMELLTRHNIPWMKEPADPKETLK
jgi:1,2-diacylglycerol 3-beta-galactosyltransferase